MRLAALLLALLLLAGCAPETGAFHFEGQERVEPAADEATRAMLAPYSKPLEPFREVVGESAVEMPREPATSPLGYWMADIMRASASRAAGKPVDVAFANWGGVRSTLPKGAFTLQTALEIMPFDNTLVLLDLGGPDARKLFEALARRGGQFPLSGAEMWVEDGRMERLLVGGEPFHEARRYTVATSDYVANGGDSMKVFADLPKAAPTGLLLRDEIVAAVKALSAEGRMIEPPEDVPRQHVSGELPPAGDEPEQGFLLE